MAIHKAKPVPARLQAAPPQAGSTPRAGRLRVGIITPSMQLGGAERWMIDLIQSTDAQEIEWRGVALCYPANSALNMVQEFAQRCPVSMGWQACTKLNHECDVVICWGIANPGQFFWPVRNAKAILVSHGMGVWTERSFQGCEFADGHVAVSQVALGPIPKNERHKAVVIYNGVSQERITPHAAREELRAEWGVKTGQKVLGYLGRLSGEKNPMAVARAVKYLPKNWVGVCVGSGLQEAEVKAQAGELAHGRVLFPGATEDIGSALAAFDIFILPSHEEACSLALIEAWLAKVPCIATPVGMMLETKRLAALIPKEPDGKTVAAAIQKDFKNLKAQAARVKRAHRFAETKLSLEAFGRNWTDYILKIAGKP